MSLAQMMKLARDSRGWSLQESADMLGCTKSHLHDMEAGRSVNPTLGLIAAIVLVYGLRPEAIIATALSGRSATQEIEK